jgi:hypothetical protein
VTPVKRSKSLSVISILIIAALSIGGWLYLNKDSNNILPGPWDRSNEANNAVIDHSLWNDFLAEYVITGDQSGLYLVDYENALGEGQNFLLEYIASLEKIDPRAYTRKEQMVY